MSEPVRIDQWLWAVRLFKTRTKAAEACRSGHVRINGQPAKASREARVGDVVVARTEGQVRTIRVLAVLEKRVGAPEVPTYFEDLAPPEDLRRSKPSGPGALAWRLPGSGRPTKRDRRRIEAWKSGAEDTPLAP